MTASLTRQALAGLESSRRLDALARGETAVISAVVANGTVDAVALRLEDLGFVPGESVRLVTRGPVGGDPLVVQVGHTRFALRRAEASRIVVE